jgi:predicted MFS family arabinose efflux permease
MLSVPIMMLVMPFWRKRVDTTSWFRALYLSIGLFIVHYIGLALVTKETLYFYPIFLVYAFMISPGINLIFSNLPFVNMPEENQTNLLGFYAAMNNFAGFLGVSLGRQFITMTGAVHLTVGSTVIGNKQLILLLTAVFMLAGVLVIYKLSRLPSVKEQEG